MQPGDLTTRYVTMDTSHLVVQCAQYLSRYAKPAECRLLWSLVLFGTTKQDIDESGVHNWSTQKLVHYQYDITQASTLPILTWHRQIYRTSYIPPN